METAKTLPETIENARTMSNEEFLAYISCIMPALIQSSMSRYREMMSDPECQREVLRQIYTSVKSN